VVLGLALTERLCAAGEVPPAVPENDSVPGLTLSVAAGFTVKVTGILAVWPLPVTVIVPDNVPADRPATLDDTVNVAGVVPVEGETLSHDAPLTLAVYVVFGLAVSDRVCEAGDVPPAVAANDNDVGITENVLVAAEIVNDTGTLT
jgi:hypothetical protein